MDKKDVRNKITKIYDNKILARKQGKHFSPFGIYSVDKHLKIIHAGTLIIDEHLVENGELFHPFQSVSSKLVLSYPVKSFKNFPEIIKGKTFENGSWTFGTQKLEETGTKILTLEDFPRVIKGNVKLSHPIFSELVFSRVNKFINEAHVIEIDPRYNGPILSFMLIKNISYVALSTVPLEVGPIKSAPDLYQVSKILNSFIENGDDILDCQEILLQNGFKEFAKL